ncbi:unnamed protein product [Prunus brigantina]
MRLYDGTTDPVDFLNDFGYWMNVKDAKDAMKCQAFPLLLEGSAKDWFKSLKPNSISSFYLLKQSFVNQFLSASKKRYPPNYLLSIKQGPKEKLRDYINRSPRERVTLPLSLGTTPQRTTVYTTFECPSAYNVILGRPALCSLRAFIASHMLFMKFPTKAGVGYVKGDQQKARECYAMASKQRRKEKMEIIPIMKKLLDDFIGYEIIQILQLENAKADSLARLASSFDIDLGRSIPVEFLEKPSIEEDRVGVFPISYEPTWMDPIRDYLMHGVLPEDKAEARRVRYRSSRYLIINKLYKRGFSLPYLRCLTPDKANYKIAQTCPKCQEYTVVPHQPPENLTSINSPWPFAQWGKGQTKFAIVVVDYFTKWAEAEPLVTITEKNYTAFLWKNIICRFGIPYSIVTNNGKQFDNAKLCELCAELNIKHFFASPAHPQANGQVEAINKLIKKNLKTRLDKAKGAWAELLPQVLWAYKTSHRTSTGDTSYALAFGAEAVVPIEIGMATHRVEVF